MLETEEKNKNVEFRVNEVQYIQAEKKKLDRDPTISEVFREMHTRKTRGEDETVIYRKYITPKTARTVDIYEQAVVEKYPDPATRLTADLQLWEQSTDTQMTRRCIYSETRGKDRCMPLSMQYMYELVSRLLLSIL